MDEQKSNASASPLREAFSRAREIPEGPERDRFLDEVCGADARFRQNLESLLRADHAPEGFLDVNPLADAVGSPGEGPGTVIGHYKILEEIGQGAFGRVFVAEQTEPVRRKVALKIIKAGMDTREVIARFEAERQALALMDHPNIARVLDAGATESGRPYFVMELIKGMAITDYCDRYSLSTAERLALFTQVCLAVQHAHQTGIIHRDLKPTNVLVTRIDGEAVPKIIDFGVAKALGQELTEKTLYTAFREIIGTPAYMSPEQAELSGVDVDTRSDVYSLGVLLYELLTGVTPLDNETLRNAGIDEIRRMIRETEPPKPSTRLQTLGEKLTEVAQHRHTEPSTLARQLHGDLDWIVMKAIEKDRRRRYGGAGEFIEDMERNLRHEPIAARPPGAGYRAGKFIRRHRMGVALVVSVTVALAVGLVGSLLALKRANEERSRALAAEAAADAERKLAERRREEAERQRGEADKQRRRAVELTRQSEEISVLRRRELYNTHINLAYAAWSDGNQDVVLDLLSSCMPGEGEEDIRTFEWRHLWQLTHAYERILFGGDGPVRAAFMQDSQHIAALHSDGIVRIWHARSGRQLDALVGHSITGRGFAFSPALAISPEGRFLATAMSGSDDLVLWDLQTKTIRYRLKGGNGGLAFSPDGSLLASGAGSYAFRDSPGRLEVYSTQTGQEVFRTEAHARGVWALAFSPDGETLASGSFDGAVKLWDTETWEQRLSFQVPLTVEQPDGVLCTAFAPNGDMLAVGYDGGRVELRDPWTAKILKTWEEGQDRLFSLAFSPDGERLAGAGEHGAVHLYDLLHGRSQALLRNHGSRIWSVDFAPDGEHLVAGQNDGLCTLWNLADLTDDWPLDWGQDPTQLSCSPGTTGVVAVGQHVVAVATSNAVHLATSLERPATQWMVALSSRPAAIALSRDDTLVAVGLETGEIQVVPTQADPRKPVLCQTLQDTGAPSMMVFSPDAKRLAAAFGTRVLILDAATGEVERTLSLGDTAALNSICFNRDGTRLVTAVQEVAVADSDPVSRVWLWDPGAGTALHAFTDPWNLRHVFSVSLSPNERFVAAAGGTRFRPGQSGRVSIFERDTGRVVQWLGTGPTHTRGVAYSPDGRTLATGDEQGNVQFWDTYFWQQRGSLKAGGKAIRELAFSGDGRSLVLASEAGEVAVWPAASLDDLAVTRESALIEYWVRAQKRNQRESAIVSSSRLIELSPDNCVYRGMRIQSIGRDYRQLSHRDYEQVIADCGEALELEPWNPTWWYERAWAHRRLGQLADAISDMSAAVRLVPESLFLRGMRARFYRAAQQWDMALADLDYCISRGGGSHLERAEVYAALEDWPKAIQDFETYFDEWTAQVNRLYYVALCYLAQEDLPGYRRTCRIMWEPPATKLPPPDESLRIWTACATPDSGIEAGDLVNAAQRVLDSGRNSRSRRMRAAGLAYYRAGDFKWALELLQESLEAGLQEDSPPNPTYTWFLLAMCSHQVGLGDDALGWYQKALRKMESDLRSGRAGQLWSYKILAGLLEREARDLLFPEAGAYEAWEESRKTVARLLVQGRERACEQQWQEAADSLSRTLGEPAFSWVGAQSDLPGVWNWVGVVFARVGKRTDQDLLCQSLATSLEQFPSPGDEARRIAKVCVLTEHPDADQLALASNLLVRAEPVSTNDTSASWLSLARGLFEYCAGRYAAAIVSLDPAAAYSGNCYGRATALLLQGMAAKRLGRDEQAGQLCRQAKAMLPELEAQPESTGKRPNILIFQLLLDEAETLLAAVPHAAATSPG